MAQYLKSKTLWFAVAQVVFSAALAGVEAYQGGADYRQAISLAITGVLTGALRFFTVKPLAEK